MMKPNPLYLGLFSVVMAGAGVWGVWSFGYAGASGTDDKSASVLELEAEPSYRTSIRDTGPAPRVLTDETDLHGNPITVSCSTCHQTRTPNFDNKNGDDLDEFHPGLTLQHGDLSCLSCHNPDDYDTLRLSDGRKLPFNESMKLCAQCHGPQYRDYQNGAHGGMTGHWSLRQGSRVRNHCIHCHDPHSPAYQRVLPVLPPKDRFLNPSNPH